MHKTSPYRNSWPFLGPIYLCLKLFQAHAQVGLTNWPLWNFLTFWTFCGTPPSCLKVVCWVGVWANQIKTLYYWRFEMTQRLTTYTQFFDRKLVQYCRLCISRNVLLHLVFQKSLYCQSINQQQNDNVEIRHFKIWLWNTFSAPVHSK